MVSVIEFCSPVFCLWFIEGVSKGMRADLEYEKSVSGAISLSLWINIFFARECKNTFAGVRSFLVVQKWLPVGSQNQSKIADFLGVFWQWSRKKLMNFSKHRTGASKNGLKRRMFSEFFDSVGEKIAKKTGTPRRDGTQQSKRGEHVPPKVVFFNVFLAFGEKRGCHLLFSGLKSQLVSGFSQRGAEKGEPKPRNVETRCPKSV